jgi:hypothetical protein
MDSFFKWLTGNPWAGYLVALMLIALLVTIVIICLMALRQGRELQFWPPKLGPLPYATPPPDGFATQKPDIGLVAYNRDSHALDNKASRIRSAKQEVWMIGATMHYTLNNQKQLIIDRVRSGLDFYLMVADPDGNDYEATARCFDQTGVELLTETDMTLKACREISKQLQGAKAKGSFYVRLMDRVVTSGVYFFDPQREEGTMFLVPHIPGSDAPITPGFEFRKVNGGILEDYFALYKSVWNSIAKPFE